MFCNQVGGHVVCINVELYDTLSLTVPIPAE